MIVSSFLVRLEPFTDNFLRLQGGHFDLPDRMFHSIKEAWLSASTRNNADVRELIPEFFYLPEFLSNHNRYDLGRKQSGVELDDVVLPPWARGTNFLTFRYFFRFCFCVFLRNQIQEAHANLSVFIDRRLNRHMFRRPSPSGLT